jgi:DtxR family transcriptional regulator, Mn-dependent transcriptional regulator
MTAPVASDLAPPVQAPEYLEAIYEMDEEGIPTVQARLAEWMGVSPGAVSQAVKKLVHQDLIRPDGRRLRFTARGEEVARHLVRRHRLAEHFLIRIIGLPWHKAHEEAQQWERVISDEVEVRLTDILNDPATCPHGNPIPGSSRRVDYGALVPLREVEPGQRVTLRRLTEDLELDLDVMRFFEESGLMPGGRIQVHSVAPDGTMHLMVNGADVALGAHLSDNLWVQAGEAGARARTRAG